MRNNFTNIQNYSVYKYKIKQKLEKLPYPDYQRARRWLPFSLGINPRTFERYLYAKHEDHFEMNVNHMYALAKFFDCQIEDLLNYEAKEIVLKGTSKREKIELAERLGLIK